MRRRPRVLVVAAVVTIGLVGTSACARGDAEANPSASTTAVSPPTTFPSGAPADHGLAAEDVEDVAAYLEAFGSSCLVVVKDGVLVEQRAWNGATVETDQEVFSITKSVLGVLVGIARDEGLLDTDDPVSTYLPEWRGTPHESVTIANLLRMDSGLEWDVYTDVVQLVGTADMRAFSSALHQHHAPGERWAYSNANTEVLGVVLERATGQTVEAFAQQRLFEPLGMTVTIRDDAAGNDVTFSGLQASCLDLARFGQLALEGGRHGDQQLVSQEWIDVSTRASQALMGPYGYLWWHNDDGRRLDRSGNVIDDGSFSWPDSPPDTFSAEGLGSQVVIVVPSEQLVVVALGPPDLPNQPEVVGNEVLRRLLSADAA